MTTLFRCAHAIVIALAIACACACACACSSSPATATATATVGERVLGLADSHVGTPVCDGGAYAPSGPEHPEYLVCAVDDDCVHVAVPSCCTIVHVALRKDRICVTDLGSACDLVCPKPALPAFPAGADASRAKCLDGRCTLARCVPEMPELPGAPAPSEDGKCHWAPLSVTL